MPGALVGGVGVCGHSYEQEASMRTTSAGG